MFYYDQKDYIKSDKIFKEMDAYFKTLNNPSLIFQYKLYTMLLKFHLAKNNKLLAVDWLIEESQKIFTKEKDPQNLEILYFNLFDSIKNHWDKDRYQKEIKNYAQKAYQILQELYNKSPKQGYQEKMNILAHYI
jgi:hypothetical protein